MTDAIIQIFNAENIDEDEENTNRRILAEDQRNIVVNILHQILQPVFKRRVKTEVDLEISPDQVIKT